MSINATKSDRKFEVVPAGNHIARVYSIIHIGTIPGEYMGEPKEDNTVRIGFELPMETRVFKEGEPERPFVVAQEYTVSMGEKANLRKLVEGVLGVGLYNEEAGAFNVLDLMGIRACSTSCTRHQQRAMSTRRSRVPRRCQRA
jgi:hypothetical protein